MTRLSDKLENLQNFFIHELSDVRAEIKNVMHRKIPDLTENKLSNNSDLLETQINFLKKIMPKQKPYNKHFTGTTFSHNHFQTTKHWQSLQKSKKAVPMMIVMNTRKNQLNHLN